MRQLTQKLKSGEMTVQEVPAPVCGSGMILVRNHFSLISPGTEGATVKTARKSLLGKAKEKPQQVKQVIDTLARLGPVQTYRAVMKKLEAYSPLGYSCAGEVTDIGDNVTSFSSGDLAACAGAGYANHAEIVAVPANLCVKLAADADLEKAAYNTMGAIAMQGIRQADPRLGETCAVIGLGLLGHLTCLMLRAAGIRVAGIDIDKTAVELARRNCADLALERDDPGIAESLASFTGGMGVDAVIITAGTTSLDPINFAGEIARKRGTVVAVGAVPTGFDREPHYYRKELQLRMSCSYGPGRYDPQYEEKGVDYPHAYVRWTERRNMAAFQDLLHSGRIDVGYLTTHKMPLDKAPDAYEMIVANSEPYLGVVLTYDTTRPANTGRIVLGAPAKTSDVTVAFVGAGSYAQGNLLPCLPDSISRKTVMTASGTTSKRVAERFGFESCTADEKDVFEDRSINTVFIATRHDTHADYVLKALESGKHVFCEKPLCITENELDRIADCCRSPLNSGHRTPNTLLVGFNRRFAPLARLLKHKLGDGPKSMVYRVNAGSIHPDSWIHDPAIGGGRIIGEVCHFVDFLTFMCGALPTRVHAAAMRMPADSRRPADDTMTVNLSFADGSVGTIAYFANGPKSMPKEYVEVYRGGAAGIIEDFKRLTVHDGRRVRRHRLPAQDKGQKIMLREFIECVRAGQPSPIGFDEIRAVTLTTFRILESACNRSSMAVERP